MSGLRPEIERQAATNVERLGENPMPGDGIVMGVDVSGERAVQVLWLASDDPLLRRRMLSHHPRVRSGDDEDSMTVVLKDGSEVSEIGTADRPVGYPAAFGKGNLHAVSNGFQTKAVMQASLDGSPAKGTRKEMRDWKPYNGANKPRMAGLLEVLPNDMSWYSLMIVRRNEGGNVEHVAVSGIIAEHIVPGTGVGAYEGMDTDARRLIMPIGKDGIGTSRIYEEILGPENLSALAVKEIDIATQNVEYTFFSRPALDG